MDTATQARRTSRRHIILGGMGGAAALVASACGPAGADGRAAGTPGAGAAGGVSGRVQWQIRESATYRDLANWAVTEFKKKHPNVTVETSSETTGNMDRTITTMVGGTGPDIFHGWGRLMVTYAGKGVATNLADLVKSIPAADVNDFVESQWKGMVIPTTNFRYGVPTYVNLFVLYYNKTIFQKRGQREPTDAWTHDDYATALKALTFTENERATWGGFGNITIPDRQYHVLSYGGHYVNPTDLTKTALDQPQAQQALEWLYARLWTDKSWAPIPAAQRPWTPNSQQDGFAQGVLATFEDGLDKLQPVATRMAQGNEWNIMHMPKGPAKRSTLITTDSWGLWSGTKNKDASWALMQFLMTKEFYEQQAKIEGFVPSRKSVMESWISATRPKVAASSPNFNFKVITDALTTMNYPQVDEVYKCQAEAERVQGEAMQAILERGESRPSYLRDVANQINQAAGSCSAAF